MNKGMGAALIAVLLLVLLISACSPSGGAYSALYNTDSNDLEYDNTISSFPDPTRDSAQMDSTIGENSAKYYSRSVSFEETQETNLWLKSGSLTYTLTGIHVIKHQESMPDEDGFRKSTDVVMYKGHGLEYEVFSYAQIIQEDGSFLDGVYLVLLDITVENHDAVMKTRSDIEDPGIYDDPYLFNAQSVLTLTDPTDQYRYSDDSGGATVYRAEWSIQYFSMLNNCKEDDMVYRLEPGEMVNFTIGVFVGNRRDGKPRDLSDLYGTTINQGADIFLIPLNIGEVSYEKQH